MVDIVYGQDDLVTRYVLNALHQDVDDFGPCATIGIQKDGSMIAGVVFNHYYGSDIQASIAASSPIWANKRTLLAIFSYPFLQLNCRRITAQTRSRNHDAITLLYRLGFKNEGQLRDWYPDDDAFIFGITRQECRWINNKQQG